VDAVPDLAQAVSVSPDGREYRFRLRPDAFWSDGAPVTADDFAYALGRIGAEGGPTAHLLEAVAAAEALDEATLALRLRGPRPYFLDILADVYACPWPRHQAEPLGERWPDLDRLVGNGPFELAERGEEGMLLRASPLWAGARGNVAEVELVDWRSSEEWGQGRFDLLVDSPRELPDSPDTVAAALPMLAWDAIFFRADRPPLDDIRVRRALAYAVDRERAAAALRLPPAAGGLIPPSAPGHGHDLALPHDPERARALLAEAGFPGGAGLPELHLNFATLSPRSDEIVAALERPWAEIGVRVRVTLRAAYEAPDPESDGWGLSFIGDFADPDAFLGTLLDGFPFVHRDAEIEGLLARARETADRAARLDLYRACDRLLVAERAAVVPLGYMEWRLLRRPWIEGLWSGPTTWATLDEVVVRREQR
jgi:ABC-type transport system substrate-binding protein